MGGKWRTFKPQQQPPPAQPIMSAQMQSTNMNGNGAEYVPGPVPTPKLETARMLAGDDDAEHSSDDATLYEMQNRFMQEDEAEARKTGALDTLEQIEESRSRRSSDDATLYEMQRKYMADEEAEVAGTVRPN